MERAGACGRCANLKTINILPSLLALARVGPSARAWLIDTVVLIVFGWVQSSTKYLTLAHARWKQPTQTTETIG